MSWGQMSGKLELMHYDKVMCASVFVCVCECAWIMSPIRPWCCGLGADVNLPMKCLAMCREGAVLQIHGWWSAGLQVMLKLFGLPLCPALRV